MYKRQDVYTTFTLYTTGVLTKEQTLEALKIKKLYDQLVLSSEKALAYLCLLYTSLPWHESVRARPNESGTGCGAAEP